MNDMIVTGCLAAMLVAAVMAVSSRTTLRSAVALAIVSVALSVIMYVLGSVWAGLFEVSVCSGFVTVIFVCAVSMTSDAKEEEEFAGQRETTPLLPILLIVAGVSLLALLQSPAFQLSAPLLRQTVDTDFRSALWTQHKGLLWAQVIVLLAGAFAVIVLFKEEK